jgi:hypothetical protein
MVGAGSNFKILKSTTLTLIPMHNRLKMSIAKGLPIVERKSNYLGLSFNNLMIDLQKGITGKQKIIP